MNLNDRQALLAGALLASVLISVGVDYMKWDEVSGLSWSGTALAAIAMVGVSFQPLLQSLYWRVWRLMPRKKMRRRGAVLPDGEAETVRLHVQDLIREYREVPRFNFEKKTAA